jgi:GNAT superfamily N-acetyltransferase
MSVNAPTPGTPGSHRPVIRPLAEAELKQAERILRVAFGTFLGAPDPENFWSDLDYVYGRFRSPHVAALAASGEDGLLGSNFVTRWGSVGFFGPITVRTDLQESGVGKALLAATMQQFDSWGVSHAGLFTFANSAKHVALYQKYGFHARSLTAIMSTPARQAHAAAPWSRYSALSEADRLAALHSCKAIAQSLYPGLDLSEEIRAVQAQGLGDTVLLQGEHGIAGFAVCHYGPRSEAGAGRCLVKFGAVADTATAEREFSQLLDACEALAVAVGMPVLLVGMNLARYEAYRLLLARGFRTEIQGVAMHRDNEPGYSRPGLFVIDDWR